MTRSDEQYLDNCLKAIRKATDIICNYGVTGNCDYCPFGWESFAVCGEECTDKEKIRSLLFGDEWDEN